MATHTILGGKVRLYRRGEGDNWHCSTYYEGREHRKSTKADTLDRAEEIAEDWYLELRGKVRAGIAIGPTGKTFDKAADAFEEEYEVITEGERSPKHVASHKANLKNHLRPFLGKMPVAEINGDTAQAYRVHRIKTATEKYGKPPARNTLHNEIITLRLVLKGAVRKGWRESVPDLSAPYKKQMKIIHRPWFSPDEYKKLYKATRANAQKQTARGRDKWAAEQLHDKVLFLGNTGMRPDEVMAHNLLHKDIRMVKDPESGELILEIKVRGKRGDGFCKSRPDAVKVYQRLLNRPRWEPEGRKPKTKKGKAAAALFPPKELRMPQPKDPVFPDDHVEVFNRILHENNLKFDRNGLAHTFYSIRHTYICMRLTEGANPYDIAKNCRTSVEMIQKHYAPHIANSINAAAVNTRRLKPRRSSDDVRAD
jgi:hypothetical protein